MRRILALSMLMIFLAGQVNLTWANHFCMSFKVTSSLMLGQSHLDCGMNEMMHCDDLDNDFTGPVFTVPACCSNDYISSDSDEHFTKSENLSNSLLFFNASYIECFYNLNPGNDEENNIIAFSPPLIQPDLQVLYQTFLL